jgi:hypothetical protein
LEPPKEQPKPSQPQQAPVSSASAAEVRDLKIKLARKEKEFKELAEQ